MSGSLGSEHQNLPLPMHSERVADPENPMPSPESARTVAHEDFLFRLYRGSELLQENRVVEAREELESALAMRPLNPKGQDLLGAVYFRLGLFPLAIQIYEALSRQFARDVSIKINLALSYLKTGQPDRASHVLKEAVRLNPDHKRAWGYLGLAHQRLGELAEAQIAFERGGHVLMAKRATERQRSVAPTPSSSPPPDATLREFAETAFLELDAGELRFSLAEPEPQKPGDGQWLELGSPAAPARHAPSRPPAFQASPEPHGVEPERTTRAPSASSLAAPTGTGDGNAGSAPEAFADTRLMPPPLIHVPMVSGSVTAPVAQAAHRTRAAPPLFDLPSDATMGLGAAGLLFVRTGDEPTRAFAARLDAIRAMGGVATTRVLHRRTRDADKTDVLGGIGSPLVRIAGEVELVLGARSAHELLLLRLHDDLAFLREDRLLGFEMALAYENGRMSLEAPADGARSSAEGTPVVQLRGSGTFAVEVAGKLSSLASSPGRPLIVRREWVVGWFGRLVTRALSSSDSPTGQRGLISFAGEGLVLVCSG